MSVTTKVPDFSWITAAPIRVLRPQDVHTRLEAFRANIASWYGEARADTVWQPDPGATKEWNERKDAMHQMIWWPFDDSDVVAEYRIDSAPVALIGLKTYNKADRIAVHGLVSHPGAALGGAIMIEWAVNFSKQRWGTINLYLHSLDDESTKFYKKIGFVEDDLADKPGPDELKLEPASSEKWSGLSDGWKLKEYAGLRYRGDHPG
jgi:hypothetical protein